MRAGGNTPANLRLPLASCRRLRPRRRGWGAVPSARTCADALPAPLRTGRTTASRSVRTADNFGCATRCGNGSIGGKRARAIVSRACRRHSVADRPPIGPRLPRGNIPTVFGVPVSLADGPGVAALERHVEQVDPRQSRRERRAPGALAGRSGSRTTSGSASKRTRLSRMTVAAHSVDALLQQPAQAPVALHPVLQLGVLRIRRLEVGQRGEQLDVVVARRAAAIPRRSRSAAAG